MRRFLPQLVIAAASVLSACGSAPASSTAGAGPGYDPDRDPYWIDLKWQAALLNAVQSVVHAPKDMDDLSAPDLHVTVQFSFHDGDIEDPRIVESTGHPDLDQFILQQVPTAVVPKPAGFDAAEPHSFSLELDVPTPLESFEDTVYPTIDAQKVYPKDAIMSGTMGNAIVRFDYLDGMIRDIAVVKSSKDHVLDSSSYNAVSRTIPPAVPPAYAHKTLHMEVMFCYSLNDAVKCPLARNVIEVRGTRIRRVSYGNR